MNRRLLFTGTLLLGASSAYAGPGLFLGVTYNFSGSVGISLKVLSTNEENRAAAAAGVSYFPMTRKFGIDAGAGYVFKNGAATIGWDFLNQSPQVGLGYVSTKNKDDENARLLLWRQQQAAPVPPAPPRGSGAR